MGPAILVAALWTALAGGNPRSLVVRAGTSLPAKRIGDWEPVDRVLVTASAGWPDTLGPLLEALAVHVPVDVLVQRGTGHARTRRFVATLSAEARARITLLEGDVDSPWVRDYGPLQVRTVGSGAVRWLDPLYVERRRDDAVPTRLAARWSVPVDPLPWSLDGGALVSDGDGHCIATFDYFETHGVPRRGPTLEREVMPAIGCGTLVFVPALRDEDTGHVDMFMQFLDSRTLAVSSVDPAIDPEQSRHLDEVADDLRRTTARLGIPRSIVRIPMGIEMSGDLLTYVNGIRVGDAFLMPAYYPEPTPTETRAAAALASAMPGVEIVRVPAALASAMPGVEILRVPAAQMADLGGALHCAALGLHLPDDVAPLVTLPR